MEKQKRKEFIQKWTEIGYLVLLAAFLAYRSFFNTMIRKQMGFTRHPKVEWCWLAGMLLVIAIRTLYLRCYSKLELLIAVSFCVVVLLAWRQSDTYWMRMMALLVVGAKGIPFDKIVKIFLITVGGVIGIAMILSLAGVITNLEYIRYIPNPDNPAEPIAISRFAFGTTYPTTFSEFMFFLSAAWLYLRRRSVKIYDLALLAAVAVLLYKGADAMTDVVCVAALIVIGFLVILLRHVSSRAMEIVHMLCAPLIAVTGVCAAAMTALMIGYDSSQSSWLTMDTLMHLRLSLGHEGLVEYGIHPFGARVDYRTTGANVELVNRADYFNLDCSYHLILINFGIVVLLFLIALFTVSSLRAWQKKDLVLLLIIVVISLESVMENRLIQLQYNIFLLIFFAQLLSEHGETYAVLDFSKTAEEDK